MTGGWHDAGDYIKFLSTTAYTTYLLLRTFNLLASEMDSISPAFSDILLEEIKTGVEWMLKASSIEERLIIQVQDLDDHNVGWRLPENDPLVSDRPAFDLPSRAQCGYFSAAIALAATTFRELGEEEFSSACLEQAKAVHEMTKGDIPDYSTGPDSSYLDRSFQDNLALASIELFRATSDSTYYWEAVQRVDSMQNNMWISWGDLNGLVLTRMSEFDNSYVSDLQKMLSYFNEIAKKDIYGYPLETYPWGSAAVQSGIAMLSILYKELTNSDEFYQLAVQQRDFIAGLNPHNVCFIGGVSDRSTRNFHHQIAYLKGIPLRGAVAAGYVSLHRFNESGIKLKAPDGHDLLQGQVAVYHDDVQDYLTNEPTIANNAQALFIYTWFALKYK